MAQPKVIAIIPCPLDTEFHDEDCLCVEWQYLALTDDNHVLKIDAGIDVEPYFNTGPK